MGHQEIIYLTGQKQESAFIQEGAPYLRYLIPLKNFKKIEKITKQKFNAHSYVKVYVLCACTLCISDHFCQEEEATTTTRTITASTTISITEAGLKVRAGVKAMHKVMVDMEAMVDMVVMLQELKAMDKNSKKQRFVLLSSCIRNTGVLNKNCLQTLVESVMNYVLDHVTYEAGLA